MSKGIVLLAFGKACYGRAAFNMAMSIKSFSPNIKICLLRDQAAFALDRFDYSVFDEQVFLDDIDISNPGLIKASLYKYLPFDHNLYLDVDGLALQDIEPLLNNLEAGKDYYSTYIVDKYDKTSPNELPNMVWAYKNDIWENWGFDNEILPATQSSIQYIRKGKEAEKLFEMWKDNILNKPIPLHKLRYYWGKTQPDELYLNATLAQLGIIPHIGDTSIFFGSSISKMSLTEIQDNYYILSIFGGEGFTKPIYTNWYERMAVVLSQARGISWAFKKQHVFAGKHSNRPKNNFSNRVPAPEPVKEINPYKILLKLPTRSRPEKAVKMLKLAFDKAKQKNLLSAVVSYDSNDETMTPDVVEQLEAIGNVKCFSGTSSCKVEAVNRDMDKAEEWDIVVLLSDDMACAYDGWDDLLRTRFDNDLDQCLHFNDGYRKREIQTLYIAGKKYYERLGYFYHKAYKSLFCDNEQMEVSKMLGKYKYFDEVLFRHEMAMNGFEQDDLHKHTESFWDEDEATFLERKKRKFAA